MKARVLSKVIFKAIKTFPAIVVTGPRQSGKTTLLKIAGDLKSSIKTSAIISISTDNFQVKKGIYYYNWKHILGV